MRFTVVLEREEDGGFVASVPALPGCVSQGDTRDEAMRHIREAVEVYVEDCRESGESIPCRRWTVMTTDIIRDLVLPTIQQARSGSDGTPGCE